MNSLRCKKKIKKIKKHIHNYFDNNESIDYFFIFFDINKYDSKDLRNSDFDILIYVIENIRKENIEKENLIKRLIEHFKYEELNYTFEVNGSPTTPLFLSIIRNKLKVARVLIELGADIEYEINSWLNVYNYIFKHNTKTMSQKTEIIKFFFKYYKNIRVDYLIGIMNNFIKNDNTKLVRYLLENFTGNSFMGYKYWHILQLISLAKKNCNCTTEVITAIVEKSKFSHEISDSMYIATLNKNKNRKCNYDIFLLLVRYDNRDLPKIRTTLWKYRIIEMINDDLYYTSREENRYHLFDYLLYLEVKFNKYINLFLKSYLEYIKNSNKKWILCKLLELMMKIDDVFYKINFEEILSLYAGRLNLIYIELILKHLIEHSNLLNININKIINEIIMRFNNETPSNKYVELENIFKLLLRDDSILALIDLNELLEYTYKTERIRIINIIMKYINRKLDSQLLDKIEFEKLLLLFTEDKIKFKCYKPLLNVLKINEHKICLKDIDFTLIFKNMMEKGLDNEEIFKCILDKLCSFEKFEARMINLKELYACKLVNNYKKNMIIIKSILKKKGNLNEENEENEIIIIDDNMNDVNNEIKIDEFLNNEKNKDNNCFEEMKKIGLNTRFFSYIRDINLEEIKYLLENDNFKQLININDNEYDQYKEYPLNIAYQNIINTKYSRNGKKEEAIKIFILLLDYGADIHIKYIGDETVLENSLNHKNYVITKIIFKYLIENHKNVNKNKNFELRNNKRRRLNDNDNDKENENDNGMNNKYEKNNNNKNEVLQYVKCKFDDLVFLYLFDESFDIKTIKQYDVVNYVDCYNNTILYYAFLKEDRNTINYLIEIGSEGLLNLEDNLYVIHGAILFNLGSIFCDLLNYREIVNKFIKYNEDYTKLFKTIIESKTVSFNNKKIMIKGLYKKLNKFNLCKNLINIAMSISDAEESEKLVLFLLEELRLKIDNIKGDSLIYALEIKADHFIDLFLKKAIYFKNMNKSLFSAIIKAIDIKNIKILEIFLNHYKNNITFWRSNYEYPFVHALNTNNLDIVKVLVDNGTNLKDGYIYKKKMSALYYALTMEKPDTEIIKYLINKKAKMNISTPKQFDELFKILDKNKNLEFLKYFIDYKEDYFINNLLKYSIKLNRKDILNILIENNINFETKIKDDETEKDITLWGFASKNKRVSLGNYIREKRLTKMRQNRKESKCNRKNLKKKKKKKTTIQV